MRQSPLGKALPSNVEAERATLGSVLMDRDAIIMIAGTLQERDFYLEPHRFVWDAMIECYENKVPPDLQTVADTLRKKDRLTRVGDLAFLVELSNSVPTSYHVEYYAQIVERTSVLRQIIQLGGNIASLGYDENADPAEVLASIQLQVQELQARVDVGAIHSLKDVVNQIYEGLADDTPVGIATFIEAYNLLTGGCHPEDFNIIAARPGVGKTSLAIALAWHIAQMGICTLYLSLEMGKEQLGIRVLSNVARVSSIRFRQGNYTSDELSAITGAMPLIDKHGDHFRIDEGVDGTVSAFRSRIIKFSQENPLGMPRVVFVDYLQLMEGVKNNDNRQNRQEEVSKITRQLKQLARELKITIIALSQLSRAVESRKQPVPMLSDLRESGSIEQDADQVMFIYQSTVDEEDGDTDVLGPMVIDLQKHRHGPIGIIPMFTDFAFGDWRELAPPYRTAQAPATSSTTYLSGGYSTLPGY